MSDEKNFKKRKSLSQLVVKGNDIIQKKRYKLTATQQKFLAYVISLMKPTDGIDTQYNIKVEDFCSICGINKDYFYDEFMKMIDRFDEYSFWVDTKDELYKFRWFNDTRYIKGGGRVELYLSRSLKDYLIGLVGNFTQYELYNIMALHSKYAIRLFELFKSYQYQHSKIYEIEELKYLLYTENYNNFAHFKRRVLEPAIKEINEFTEIKVSYETLKKGKKITHIKFIIELKGNLEKYKSYKATIEQINRDNGQIEGQLSIEDYFNEVK